VTNRKWDYGIEVKRSSTQSRPRRKELIFGEVQMTESQPGRKEVIFGKYRRTNLSQKEKS